MRTLLASCILACSVAPAISAQDKPDFSGQWVLVSPINGAANAQTMTVRESFKRESVNGTPMDSPLITLAVERRSDSGVHSEVYTVGTVGGIVGGAVGNPGTERRGQSAQTRFSTAWDGDTLVIDIRYSGRPVDAGAESEHKEMWSLDPQGALLLITTDRSPGTEPTTTTLMYRRRP
jgi:hypothetical protein